MRLAALLAACAVLIPHADSQERITAPWQFPFPQYEQRIEVTFATEADAEAATFALAPLYNGHAHAVVSRWDDNHIESNLTMKSYLDKHGVKGTWYLNTNDIFYLNGIDYEPIARQLLEGGHSLGGHALSHPYITFVHRNRAFEEMAGVRIEWESRLDTLINSYAFSFVDYRGIEGDPVHRDLVHTLERAGYFHIAAFKGFADQMPNGLEMSAILPPENAPFDEFAKAVEWAFTDPDIAENYPGISHSMHSWYATAAVPFGWDELEKRLIHVNEQGEAWRCNQNDYAAYRRQYRASKLEVIKREGETVTLTLMRPKLVFLNNPAALTLEVRGVESEAVERVAMPDAGVVPGVPRADGVPRFHLGHGKSQYLPRKIDRVENRGNVPKQPFVLMPGSKSSDFPGLHAWLHVDARGALRLRIDNKSATPMRDATVTYRLSLQYKEGVRHQPLPDIAGDYGFSEAWHPTPTGLAKTHVGTRYFAAQIDFRWGEETGRVYATCHVPNRPDTTYPKYHFAVMGPLQPESFDADSFDAFATAPGALTNAWSTSGGEMHWRLHPDEGPVPREHLDYEVIRTQGTWYEAMSPLYVLGAYVHSDAAQPFSIFCDQSFVRHVYLNGKKLDGFAGELREGRNEFVVVYWVGHVPGTAQHAGCFWRLESPAGERLTNIRYEAPPHPKLPAPAVQGFATGGVTPGSDFATLVSTGKPASQE